MPQPKSSAAAGKTPARPPRMNTRGPTTPTHAKGKNSVAKRSATPPAPDAPNPKPAPTVKAKQARIKRAKPKQAKTKQAKAAPRSKTGSKA
jgi:hypothetical protein